MRLNRVLETCLYARDLEQVEKFYTEVLGLEVHSKEEERHVFFRCGNAMLLIFNPDKTMELGKAVPPHGAYGQGHIAFGVMRSELSYWRQHLAEKGIEIEAEVAWPNDGKSMYFRDPASNSIELVTPKTWGIVEDALE